MKNQEIIAGFKKWQSMSIESRSCYLDSFVEHMVYTTTKCEYPEVTFKMVRGILK